MFLLHLSKERTPIASTILFVSAASRSAKVARGQTNGRASAREMSGMKYQLIGFLSDSPRKSRLSDSQDFFFALIQFILSSCQKSPSPSQNH
jgi:hypothetical protein